MFEMQFTARRSGAAGRGWRHARLRWLLMTTTIGTGAVLAGLPAGPALADCVLDGTVITCATPDTDGYAETVTTPFEGRTLNVSADVDEYNGTTITLRLIGSGAPNDGGDIVVNHTAGTVSNYSGGAYRLETDGGDVTVDIGGEAKVTTGGWDGLSVSGRDVTITVSGEIDAGNRGIYVDLARTVEITNTGSITGEIAGIEVGDFLEIYYGDGTARFAEDVTIHNNGGTIKGDWSDGIALNGISGQVEIWNDGGSVTGGLNGIYAYYLDGDLLVSNEGGTIKGRYLGIGGSEIDGAVTVLNDGGTITAKSYGAIDVYNVGGPITVSNQKGTISGGSAGVATLYVSSSVDVSNLGGAITGKSYGIDIYGAEGFVSVDNRDGGTIRGGNKDGVDIGLVNGSVHVRNNGGSGDAEPAEGGQIEGGTHGVYVSRVEDGSVTIENQLGGSIHGESSYGVIVYYVAGEGADVLVSNFGDAERAGGSISGGEIGVNVTRVHGSVEIDNRAGGQIEGGAGVTVGTVGGDVLVVNSGGGRIEGTGDTGLATSSVAGRVTIDNRNGGLIAGAIGVAVRTVGGDVLVANSGGGRIEGTEGFGLVTSGIQGQVTIDNRDGGSIISAEDAGLIIDVVTGSVLVRNSGGPSDEDPAPGGEIEGATRGLYVYAIEDGSVAIDNRFGGSIHGEIRQGIFIADVSGKGAGVLVDNSGDAERSGGSITGGDMGVYVTTVDGSVGIDNSGGGLIEGGVGVAVSSVAGDLMIDNRGGGRIEGRLGAGIATDDVAGLVTIDNRGGVIDSTGPALKVAGGGVALVNGGWVDEAGTVHAGWISGGTEPGATVIQIVTDAYDSKSETGGAVILNFAGGVIASSALTSIETVDAAEIAAAAGDVAILADGGRVLIENDGLLIGRVLLTGQDDAFANLGSGSWIVTGESDFGAGEDALYNAGRIFVVGEATFLNLANAYNHGPDAPGATGVIDMADGDTGGRLGIDGNYHGGQGGGLWIDAELGLGGASDRLHVGGEATGTTHVLVNDLGSGWAGYDPDGVLVVEVEGGAAGPDTFTLASGPIPRGFFSYDLVHEAGPDGDRWYLRNHANAYAEQVVDLGVAATQLWHQSASSWSERSIDLRGWVQGGQSAALSSRGGAGAQYAAAGGTATDTLLAEGGATGLRLGARPGVWGRAFGTAAEWGETEQRSWGVQVGADVAVATTATSAFVVGVLAGYARSDLDFGGANSSGTLSGPTLGAYATYVDGGFYVDALVKADVLSVEYAVAGARAETDGLSWGARVETGYRLDVGTALFVEPRASLAYVRTDIDDFSMMGNTVRLGSGESLQGMLGLRAGTVLDAGGLRLSPYVTADIGNEFRGGFSASFDAGGPMAGVSGGPGGLFGQVGAGIDLIELGGGVAAFASASYRFGDELDGLSGSLGLRVSW